MAPQDSGVGPTVTEEANPRTAGIDRLPLGEMLALLLGEDAGVPAAVGEALPEIERAAQMLIETLERGGRWFNVGAGTSGRIGLLDAAEIPPTYGMDPSRVQAVLAGGTAAVERAVEGAEDDPAAAAGELRARGFGKDDALVALSASGRTPFVIGAVEHARELGARTIAITCAPGSALAEAVDCPIVAVVGPEAIAGSTRLKGGLAQKMILHMLSTAVMIRLGRVQGNLMSNLRTASGKLRERAVRIAMQLSGRRQDEVERALDEADGSVPDALEKLRG